MLKQKRIITKTESATLTLKDMGNIICDSANAQTYTLPSVVAGLWYNFVNIGTGVVTISDGTTIATLNQNHQAEIINNGTDWVVGANNTIGIEYRAETKSISFYIDDVLTVSEKTMSVLSPCDLEIKSIKMAVDTAPTGATIICDINKNGTTMYTTQANRPTIEIDATTETATLPDIVAITAGDKITLDIDQIGSTVAGENLSVIVICEVA